jgi:hypothetical protein
MKSMLLETTVQVETSVQAEVAARRPRLLSRFAWPVVSDRWPLVQKILRDRAAVVGLLIIMGLLSTAALAPYLAPFPEDVSARIRRSAYWRPVGRTPLGRCWGEIYSRLRLGRLALVIALSVVGPAWRLGYRPA